MQAYDMRDYSLFKEMINKANAVIIENSNLELQSMDVKTDKVILVFKSK